MATANGINILLVDDEAALLGLQKRHLERLGYRVEAALTAEAALEHLDGSEFVPAVLISDETLPGQRGSELAVQLLERFPAMVCLLCSGYPLSVEVIPSASRSRVAILQKPYLPAMLEQAILQTLSGA